MALRLATGEEREMTKKKNTKGNYSIFFYDYWNLKNSFQGRKKYFIFINEHGRSQRNSMRAHSTLTHIRAY